MRMPSKEYEGGRELGFSGIDESLFEGVSQSEKTISSTSYTYMFNTQYPSNKIVINPAEIECSQVYFGQYIKESGH